MAVNCHLGRVEQPLRFALHCDRPSPLCRVQARKREDLDAMLQTLGLNAANPVSRQAGQRGRSEVQVQQRPQSATLWRHCPPLPACHLPDPTWRSAVALLRCAVLRLWLCCRCA